MAYSILKKYFFIILVLTQSLFIYSQEKIHKGNIAFKSSLHQRIINYTNKVSKFGLEKNFDSATYYSQKVLLLSKENNNIELTNYANITKARLLYWEDSTNEAILLLRNILSKEIINDSIKINAHFLSAEIENYEKRYIQSLKQYINIEKIINKKDFLTKKDSNKISLCNFKIGSIHLRLKNNDKAKLYFDNALSNARGVNLKNDILFRISALYNETRNIPQAIKYAKKATDIASKNKWQLMLPTYYAGLSDYYLEYKKADSAIYYAKRGLKNNTYCRLNWLNARIGNGYLLKKEYSKAIKYFKIALQYTTPSETLSIYETLREIYTQTKQYKLALHQNNLFLVLKDSLDNLKVKQEIVDITEKYESDKKQTKIKFLNDKNELNTIIIKKQKSFIISIISLFLLIISILGLIVYLYVRRQKKKYKLYVKNRQKIQKLNTKESSTIKNELLPTSALKKKETCNYITNLIKSEFYLDKGITLLKMAKMAKTNSSYLSKIINEDYDKSFTNFINELRISYTLKKLESFPEYRKLTIEHIAENAGFTSSNAFYRAFKKYTQLTPAYYIKKRLKDKDG
jgi:AraC-like DNA-binding protein